MSDEINENANTQAEDQAHTENKADAASNIVSRYVYGSMAAGVMLLPGVDVLAILGIQLKMLHSICKIYGIPFSENMGKSLISGLIGSLGSATVARGTFGSLVKLVPIFGPFAGSVAMPIISGASTYAIGKIFIKHFQDGGSIIDFNAKKVRQDFVNLYEEGKNVASSMRKKDTPDPGESGESDKSETASL